MRTPTRTPGPLDRSRWIESAGKTRRIAFALGLLLVLATTPASATQHPWGQTRGISVHLQLLGNQLDRADSPKDSTTFAISDGGQGLDLGLGYSFNSSFYLQLSGASAVHTTSQPEVEVLHSTVVLEAHWRLLPAKRGRPFLFVGLGGSSLDVKGTGTSIQASGGVSVVGAGFLYNLTHHLILDAALRVDFINWEKVTVREQLADGRWVSLDDPVEESGQAGKFRFGLRWEF